MTIRVRGTVPQQAHALTPRMREDAIGAIVDTCLSLADWSIEHQALAGELVVLQRRMLRRGSKLQNPDLFKHPGRAQAAKEYELWGIRARAITPRMRELQSLCHDAAVYTDKIWRLLGERDQQDLKEASRRCRPETVALIGTMADITQLPAWIALLPGYGGAYEVCPL